MKQKIYLLTSVRKTLSKPSEEQERMRLGLQVVRGYQEARQGCWKALSTGAHVGNHRAEAAIFGEVSDDELLPITKESKKIAADVRWAVARFRLRLENAEDVHVMSSILDEKCYIREFPTFWIPLIVQLQEGAHHRLAVEVFEWMRKHRTLLKHVDKSELSRLFSLMISYAGLSRNPKLARTWFEDMVNRGVPKQAGNCNALMLAHAKNLEVDKALGLFKFMKDSLELNGTTYDILVSMYAKANDVDKMETTFRSGQRAGVSTNLFCYNTLLHTYARMRLGDKLEATYTEMRAKHVKGNATTFSCLIVGFAQLDMVEQMEQAFKDMEDAKIKLSPTMGQEMVNAYTRAGLVDSAKELISKTPGLVSA